ncbi:MAG TPA: SH3 domain-containing protein [Kofleriaceae bacterium]|nr:SH3 domain-containing protein [Kofleriaceae bacterium]
MTTTSAFSVRLGTPVLALTLALLGCGVGDATPGIDEDLDAPQVQSLRVGGQATVVDTDGLGLRLREGPGLDQPIQLVMPEGSTVDIEDGPDGGWYQVRFEGMSGWSFGAYLGSGEATETSWVRVAGTGGEGLNLRSGPGPDRSVLAVMPEGAIVPRRGDDVEGWVPVDHHGIDGWASSAYLVASDAPPAAGGDGGGVPGARLTVEQIVGGAYAISQGYGPSDFDGGYGYCQAYGDWGGVNVHCGVDVSIAYGTPLHAPEAGVVAVVGSGYYADETGGPGEIRLRTGDGTEIILGHTSSAAVGVGQEVGGGAVVGASGTANGAHVHLEVRRPDGAGGFYTVDPMEYFGP